ncbi:HAMP domain-containing sensor histidine kinase [Deinococcus sp.]|uniref:sensor histidine kinase n=1 Tax=Deinococcus sp. TaxID=47478 RepID=UPI003CC69E40
MSVAPAWLSLRLKLTFGYALIFTFSVLLGALGVFLAARSTLTHTLEANLRETAHLARAEIETRGGQPRFAPEYQPSGEVSIELLRASGERMAQVGNRTPLPKLSLRQGLYRNPDGRRVLTLALSGGTLLRVSRASDSLDEVVEVLGRVLLLGSGLMIVVACAAGYFLADRALRPVDAVVRMADSIAGSGQYAQRVAVSPGSDEMARLTRTVNRMLDRLSGTIEREKEFARIAAHELRTPLTAIKGRLDLALERPRDEETLLKTLAVMQSRVNALVTLSEALLELARTDTAVQLAPLELGAAALSVTETLRDPLLTSGKRLELDIEEVWIRAETPGLHLVIQNLLGNALKYGGPLIRVRVGAGTFSVCDSGPGPAQTDWARLLRPFERGAGLQHVPGSGLGLALVAAHVGRWPAHLSADWRPEGFTVSVAWQTGDETAR